MEELKNTTIMANEPLCNVSVAEFKTYFTDKTDDGDCADAYAAAHNKFWWVEDDVYDYEVGTPEHAAARAVADAWGELMDSYMAKMLEISKKLGLTDPSASGIRALEPIMEKYGYTNNGGWWIRKK